MDRRRHGEGGGGRNPLQKVDFEKQRRSENVVFDFEDGDFDAWLPAEFPERGNDRNGNNWSITEDAIAGEYSLQNEGEGGWDDTTIVTKDRVVDMATDFEISFKWRSPDPNNRGPVLSLATKPSQNLEQLEKGSVPPDDGLFLWFDADAISSNGSPYKGEAGFSGRNVSGLDFSANKVHSVRIRKEGSTATLYLDGERQVEVSEIRTQGEYFLALAGRAGTWGSPSTIVYDDIIIGSVGGGELTSTPTNTPTSTATPPPSETATGTETRTTQPTDNELSVSGSYVYRPVTLAGDTYWVVWNLEQFDSTRRAVVREPSNRGANMLTLVPPATAFDALITDSWVARPYTRDYDQLIEVAKQSRAYFGVMEIFSRLSSILGEWAAAYAMAHVNPTVAVPVAIEALKDSIIWAYDEITNPYQEALSKFEGLTVTERRLQAEIKDVTTATELPRSVLNLIINLQGAASQIKSTASMTAAMGRAAANSAAGTSSLSAALSAGGASATPTVLYFIAGELFRRGVEIAVNGYEAEAKVAALGHAFATLRLPYLRELKRYQQLGREGRLTPGMAIHYQIQEAHQSLLGAVANGGMYKFASAASSGLFGGLYDILVNADGIASSSKQKRDSFHKAAASSLDILQSRWTVAEQRHQRSINVARLRTQSSLQSKSTGAGDIGGGSL